MYLYKVKLNNGSEFDVIADSHDLVEVAKKCEYRWGKELCKIEYIGMPIKLN